MGLPVVPVRDAVVARGITINGLPLTLRAGTRGAPYGGLGAGLLDIYYEDCVIGGPGAFFLSVQAPEQLADAIRRKLVLEIAGRGADADSGAAGATPATHRLPDRREDAAVLAGREQVAQARGLHRRGDGTKHSGRRVLCCG